MAYWGMAMANVNNTNRTRGILKEARKRGARLDQREALYLEALEAFYKEPVRPLHAAARALRQGARRPPEA